MTATPTKPKQPVACHTRSDKQCYMTDNHTSLLLRAHFWKPHRRHCLHTLTAGAKLHRFSRLQLPLLPHQAIINPLIQPLAAIWNKPVYYYKLSICTFIQPVNSLDIVPNNQNQHQKCAGSRKWPQKKTEMPSEYHGLDSDAWIQNWITPINPDNLNLTNTLPSACLVPWCLPTTSIRTESCLPAASFCPLCL